MFEQERGANDPPVVHYLQEKRARGNTKIFNEEDKEIGKITSGTFGPSVDCSIAMGYVENNYSPTNTKVFLEVRGKKIPANVCDLPFYKKNYVKGEKNGSF